MRFLKVFSKDHVNHRGSTSDEKAADPGTLDHQQRSVHASNSDPYNSDGDSISSGNEGLKKAQATTIVWTRNALIIAYGLYVRLHSDYFEIRILMILQHLSHFLRELLATTNLGSIASLCHQCIQRTRSLVHNNSALTANTRRDQTASREVDGYLWQDPRICVDGALRRNRYMLSSPAQID